ncbi:hypothetical protein [Myxosarcina sp. GI1]|uniref:hypothetical protein n=1 Tax=Myxosarcina sp. GI1 TaxID=1541065 RepID=UPI000560DEA1|nr:hypothetical protein [Myxosarcina sp. GI1]
MTNTTLLTQATDLSTEDYCVLGVATCFLREEGEVTEVKIVEPIPSAALEALIEKIPTSYQAACSKTLGEILIGDKIQIPSELPQDASLCERFEERILAAARTYKSRPEAKKHIPLGTIKQDFNYSLERKRVLNSENIVRPEDNVKQHEHTHKVL